MKHRIVSLCPSSTQTLFDLGLGNQVIARTRFCENMNGELPQVGGTKDPDWKAIAKLQPTHILFNLEENDHTQLEQARAICETIVHTPVNLEESKQFVLDLGQHFDARTAAKHYAEQIDSGLLQLSTLQKTFSFLYFIWHPNKRLAGLNTYINAMLSAAGGTNLAGKFSQERYPLLPELLTPTADIVLLSSEPFPYKEKHLADYGSLGKVALIDGEPICWHGTRTADGLAYLARFVQEQIDV